MNTGLELDEECVFYNNPSFLLLMPHFKLIAITCVK